MACGDGPVATQNNIDEESCLLAIDPERMWMVFIRQHKRLVVIGHPVMDSFNLQQDYGDVS